MALPGILEWVRFNYDRENASNISSMLLDFDRSWQITSQTTARDQIEHFYNAVLQMAKEKNYNKDIVMDMIQLAVDMIGATNTNHRHMPYMIYVPNMLINECIKSEANARDFLGKLQFLWSFKEGKRIKHAIFMYENAGYVGFMVYFILSKHNTHNTAYRILTLIERVLQIFPMDKQLATQVAWAFFGFGDTETFHRDGTQRVGGLVRDIETLQRIGIGPLQIYYNAIVFSPFQGLLKLNAIRSTYRNIMSLTACDSHAAEVLNTAFLRDPTRKELLILFGVLFQSIWKPEMTSKIIKSCRLMHQTPPSTDVAASQPLLQHSQMFHSRPQPRVATTLPPHLDSLHEIESRLMANFEDEMDIENGGFLQQATRDPVEPYFFPQSNPVQERWDDSEDAVMRRLMDEFGGNQTDFQDLWN
jgi:hypothetical protein